VSDINYQVWKSPDATVPVKAWVNGVEFEEEAHEQIRNIAKMPFVYPHVAVMPDVHAGIGATVGSVIPTRGAIIPAAVGVDIGCGMMALRLPLTASDLPDSLAALRNAIERAVPHGRTNNGGPGDRGAWGNVPKRVEEAVAKQLLSDMDAVPVLESHNISVKNIDKQLGTLGTGNHFIEVCLDEEQRVWVVLHSGSRGIGNKIGSTFIELAKKDMERWFINLPNKDLAYFPEDTEHFWHYVAAVRWAQRYARVNRELMMIAVLEQIAYYFPEKVQPAENALDLVAGYDMVVNCHHNYVNRESHGGKSVLVTRKGAVRARQGDLGIIPGSMGARSYIVRGKGSEDSLHSCSHGAGRKMSRTKAKKIFTLEDHAEATKGVECRKDADVIDETPGAYKDIDRVMEAQKDLVDIVHTLKQVLCVKG
jgi:tRNA-splicing ligase RtcB